MKTVRYLGLGVSLIIVVSLALVAQSDNSSIRSWPPDLNSYSRRAIPADKIPLDLEEYQGVFQTPTVVDVVVNNTDLTLKNTDAFNDGEPTVAVNPLNPNEIALTAFSGGWGVNAPLWHSTDGGNTWTKRFTVPAPPGITAAIGCPCDQAVDYGRANALSGTFLTFGASNNNIFSGTTTTPASAAGWNWLLNAGVAQRTNSVAFNNVDQPWLLVNRDPTVAARDNIYVGYDDFNSAPDMRVATSSGTNPPNFTLDTRSGFSTGFVNPGHRLAVDHRNGTVYSLFQRRIAAGAGGSQNINYMLNRSTDGGNNWVLNASTTGIVVANADSTQPTAKFGGVNALLGGVLHAAVDPMSGDVYYVYGNRDSVTGNNRIAIRRLQTTAGNIVIGPELFVTGQVQAALPSVAVADNGVVAVFYYTFDGPVSGFPQFTAHLALSANHGTAFSDRDLETFLSSANDNGSSRQRVFGDYVQIKSVGNVFYGVFTGNGVPFGRTVSNHDPIFYKQSALIIDTTPPVIVPAIAGTIGPDGPYVSDVTVTWSVTDPESGITSSTGCGPTTLTDDTPGTTLTCSATNGVGLTNSVSVTIVIDKHRIRRF